MSADPHRDKLAAALATVDKYVERLLAVTHRTAAQNAKLTMYQDRRSRYWRALQAYDADPDVPAVELIDIGPDPLPNNAQPSDTTYGCPDGFDAKAFEERYGFTVQEAFNRIVTGILRPHTPYTEGARVKQVALIDYFAGKIPFSQVAGYFGGWYDTLGCDVNIDQIHDLGASFGR